MVKEELRNIIVKRIATDDNYDYGVKKCWKEMVGIVKKDTEEALAFIESFGTDEEVYWLSEVLCEIYDETLDERFIEAFDKRADKMTDPEMKRSIKQEIRHV